MFFSFSTLYVHASHLGNHETAYEIDLEIERIWTMPQSHLRY